MAELSNARQIANYAKEVVNVKDFGAKGNGDDDDTAAIQAAILNVSTGGEVHFDAGTYLVSATLTLPGMVSLVGKGAGRVLQPTQAPATTIKWGGAAGGTLIQVGHQVGCVAGGGIEGIRVDANVLAAKGVSIKDHQHGYYKDVCVTGSTAHAVYFTNTDGLDPTGLSLFEDLQISLRGGSTDSCNGITFDGVGTGVAGVTICTFIRPRIEHANGAGIYIGLRGDGMMWVQPQIFRADSETGIGVWAASTDADQVIGGHTFVSPIISSGIRVDYPGAAGGWYVSNADDVNVNSGFTRFVYGRGADDVTVVSSYSGRLGGPLRTFGWRDTMFHDAMCFMSWDSTNGFLRTRDGTWRTSTGAGTTIADATQPGGAVQLTTSNVSGSEVWMVNTPAFTSGVSLVSNLPQLNQTIAPITLTDVTIRFGLFNDFGASPANGAYVQFDPAVSANFIANCVSGGVSTTVDTGVGAAIAKTQWRVEATEGYVNFFYRTGSNKLWALGASISTNLTTSPLSVGYYIKTNANAFAGLHIYDVKYSHLTE